MKRKATPETNEYEEQLVRIARRLPPEQVLQLVDFARFLELKTSDRFENWLIEDTEEGESSGGQTAWNELLDQPEAKRVLREMASEAREDYQAGRTTGLGITEDGRLEPD